MKKNEINQNGITQSTALRHSLLGSCMLSALFLFSACQKDDYDNGKTSNLPTEEQIVVNNNSSELSTRVTVYAQSQNAKSTVHLPEISMPAPPDMSQIGKVVDMSIKYEDWKVSNKTNYYLPKGKQLSTGINMANNTTYYVEGELTVTGIWGTSSTIVVLPDGKLNFSADMPAQLSILNYGTLNLKSATTVRSELMTTGDIAIQSLTVDNGGIVYAGGKIEVNSLQNSVNAVVKADCSIEIKTPFTMNNNSTVIVNNYLKAPAISMNSAAILAIRSGALVETDKLALDNSSCIVTVFGDQYAVLAAKEVVINQQNVKQMFTGWLDIHTTTLNNLSGKELEWLSNIKFDGDTYLPAEGDCRPAFGEPAETEKSYELDHFAEISSPDHQHDISATSIQIANGKAYASYHTRGDDFGGCIEAIAIPSPDQCQIVSFMEAKGTLDFNHIIADQNQLWVVGGERKGAFMANINLQNGLFPTGQTVLNKYRLTGNSGNCIIQNGEYLITASNAGYETFQASDLTKRVSDLVTPGSAKFLHQNNDRFISLTLQDKNDIESTATINTYAASDNTLSTPVSTIEAGTIKPTNGKNVAKIDGDVVFVCLGQNGVKAFKNGVEQASFKLDVENGEAANGLDVDDQFVYVAYGTGGLYVLDKTDLSVVASYKQDGGKSANYVTVTGDKYIYVAYGLSGLQIFRLVEMNKQK